MGTEDQDGLRGKWREGIMKENNRRLKEKVRATEDERRKGRATEDERRKDS